MLKTFNCGIGMVVVVQSDCVKEVTTALEEAGEQVWVIGSVSDLEDVRYEGSLG
jgi:phosphoribosylformylglycinamidine cyclo-ligase